MTAALTIATAALGFLAGWRHARLIADRNEWEELTRRAVVVLRWQIAEIDQLRVKVGSLKNELIAAHMLARRKRGPDGRFTKRGE